MPPVIYLQEKHCESEEESNISYHQIQRVQPPTADQSTQIFALFSPQMSVLSVLLCLEPEPAVPDLGPSYQPGSV